MVRATLWHTSTSLQVFCDPVDPFTEMSPPGRSQKSMPRLLLRSVCSCPSIIFYLRLFQGFKLVVCRVYHQLCRPLLHGVAVYCQQGADSKQPVPRLAWAAVGWSFRHPWRGFFFLPFMLDSAVGPFPLPDNFSTSPHWTCIVHVELCAVGVLENRTQAHLRRLPLCGQIPTQTQYCNSHIRLHFWPPPKPKDGVSFGRNVLNPPSWNPDTCWINIHFTSWRLFTHWGDYIPSEPCFPFALTSLIGTLKSCSSFPDTSPLLTSYVFL